ncbi:MAG TPA: NUDIX domain-containing protein [Pseudolabrys sp.]|nr:NUDIX domain-containing protein [Pseudolabrys sp.]
MARKPIQAAGGIVVRRGAGARRLFAVVQRAKDDRWVLPRGKLKARERPVVAARREVFEETGHRVVVHAFAGAITYRAQARPKLVQFWHMAAAARPSRDLMRDIAAVAWLPLRQAVKRLSYPLEKLFLNSVGRNPARRMRKSRRKTVRKANRKAMRKARPRRG